MKTLEIENKRAFSSNKGDFPDEKKTRRPLPKDDLFEKIMNALSEGIPDKKTSKPETTITTDLFFEGDEELPQKQKEGRKEEDSFDQEFVDQDGDFSRDEIYSPSASLFQNLFSPSPLSRSLEDDIANKEDSLKIWREEFDERGEIIHDKMYYEEKEPMIGERLEKMYYFTDSAPFKRRGLPLDDQYREIADKEDAEYKSGFGGRDEYDIVQEGRVWEPPEAKVGSEYKVDEEVLRKEYTPANMGLDGHFIDSHTDRHFDLLERQEENPFYGHIFPFPDQGTLPKKVPIRDVETIEHSGTMGTYWGNEDFEKGGPRMVAIGEGKRKSARAKVVLMAPGTGEFRINGRNLVDYFPTFKPRQEALFPFEVTETIGHYDCSVDVQGGGFSGQAGAIKMAVAHALVKYDPDSRFIMRKSASLQMDQRKVERKKTGQPKARKKKQWVKR